MNETPTYREYHPKPYRPRVSTYWWLFQRSYFRFILRELSSVSVAFFVVVTLLQISALSRGPEAYAAFQQWLKSPLLLTLNAISFLFVVLHTITWFNAAPRAMAIRVGGKRLPDLAIALPNYAAWLAVSAGVIWLLLGG